jgi:phosphomannomutase
MSLLKVSVSGIRGIWADSLGLESLLLYTKAFGHFIREAGGKTILLGRDARPTGDLITRYVSSVLNALGLSVIDAGIVPTPTILFGVRKLQLDGGIIITASHNPIEWNALKFVKKGGVFTGEKDVEQIQKNLSLELEEVSFDRIGTYQLSDEVSELHIEEILKLTDVSLIKKKQFKVVLDPVNSAGSLITQKLLKRLGCSVHLVHGEINGRFERGTEPNRENLKHLEKIVLKAKAAIAFAQDPDADRLVAVDEKGEVLSEEMTLGLALEAVLSQKKGDIVVNMSTSFLCDEIARKHGVKCHRTKVGEANVVEGIDQFGALIGGEGNGGVIYPAMNKARDSLAGIALILELLARREQNLSEVVKNFPKYFMVKEKFHFNGDLGQLFIALKGKFPLASVNELDGLRLDWEEDSSPVWVHIRASNTEPVVRVIGESTESEKLQRALRLIEEEVKRLL